MTDDADRNDPTAVLARRTLAWLLDAASFLAAFLIPVVAFGQRFTGAAIAAEPPGFRFEGGDATLWFPGALPALGDSVLVVPGSKFWLAVAVADLFLIINAVVVQGLTGATFGKAVCGIRCVTREQARPGMGRALARSICWIIDLIPILIVPVAFILASFTKGHRRVGDFVAGTFVVERSFARRLAADDQSVEDAEFEESGFGDAAGGATIFDDAEEPAVAISEPEHDQPAVIPEAATARPAAAAREVEAEAEAAPERSTEPVWDDDLDTYVRWEPSVGRWIGWDEAAQKWRVVDPSRRG